MDLLKMNVVCVIFVLCISAITVQGRSKSPLIDEDGTRIFNKAAECIFGSQVRELGSSWVPDLGVPIGVLYCMKCECVPSQRKRRIVARVQCRSIKNECPEPTCDEPVLLPGNCCKSCPGDNYSEEIHDVVPQNAVDDEEKSTKHYAALLTGRSSLVLRNDDMKPIVNDNKNNVIATGRFTFQKKNLYFSFYISDKAARPRSLQFVDQDGNILEEIVLSGSGGMVNSIYQNATRKVCGVWKRLPRDYRRLLKDEKLYAVLVWGVKGQAEFMLSGQITKYVALGTELFSSLLEPAPGTDSVAMAGAGGTAIVSTSSPVSPSIHIAIVFSGIISTDDTDEAYIDISLTLEEHKRVILQEKRKVDKRPHSLNFVEISSPLSPNDLRQLTRGKLMLSISSTNRPAAMRLNGNVMTKATCELFQTTLSSPPGSNSNSTSGLAWLFLNNEGSLVYNIQVDGLLSQQKPMAITLMDVSSKRKTDLEDLTPYYKKGWVNGTIDKIGPKVLEPLYSGNLAVNVATESEASWIRGRLSPRLVADARDAAAPVLLKRENYTLPVGMAWINVDNDCNIHYDVSLTGPGNQDRQLELYIEFLPMLAPGAPVITRYLGEIQGNQAEGSPTETLRKEELNRLDSGVCFIKVKEKHTGNTLLKATLKQVKVPLSCLPHYTDNDVTSAIRDVDVPQTGACLHEGRFFEEEASWTSIQDPCTMCYCQNGNAKCDTTTCPQLNCSSKMKNPGECCPVCSNHSVYQDKAIPSGCTFGGKFYSSGSKFHPFLIPNGFDTCTECSCEGSEVKCTRQSNERLCCKNCETAAMAMSENGTYQGDAKPMIVEVLRPMHTTTPPPPRRNPQAVLDDGGCRNPSNAFMPYENGQTFHPFIATLGEYKCVTCKCTDGMKKCERPKCNKALCHKMLKSQRKNTLNMNSPESCCSLQQCKQYRRHHRAHKSPPS